MAPCCWERWSCMRGKKKRNQQLDDRRQCTEMYRNLAGQSSNPLSKLACNTCERDCYARIGLSAEPLLKLQSTLPSWFWPDRRVPTIASVSKGAANCEFFKSKGFGLIRKWLITVSSLCSGHFWDLVSSLARAESVVEFISVKNICNLFYPWI